jgi:hypothetical protein
MILDQVRSQVLRNTLRIPTLAQLYANREKRTLALFCASVVFNTALVALLPEVSFYLGPLILGVPHLVASLRFSAGGSGAEFSTLRRLIALMGVVIALKLIEYSFEQSLGYLPEAIAFGGSASILSRSKLMLLLTLPFLAAFYFLPIVFPLTLLMLHNYVAFVFWWREARSPDQKKIVLVSAAILSVGILFLVISTSKMHEFGGLLTLRLFGSMNSSYLADILLRVFLVSQAAHYFIWLKAIPDFQNPSPTPSPFRQTFDAIRAQLGTHAVRIMVAFSFLIFGIVFWFDLEEARLFYIYGAAFHGISELGILIGSRR